MKTIQFTNMNIFGLEILEKVDSIITSITEDNGSKTEQKVNVVDKKGSDAARNLVDRQLSKPDSGNLQFVIDKYETFKDGGTITAPELKYLSGVNGRFRAATKDQKLFNTRKDLIKSTGLMCPTGLNRTQQGAWYLSTRLKQLGYYGVNGEELQTTTNFEDKNLLFAIGMFQYVCNLYHPNFKARYSSISNGVDFKAGPSTMEALISGESTCSFNHIERIKQYVINKKLNILQIKSEIGTNKVNLSEANANEVRVNVPGATNLYSFTKPGSTEIFIASNINGSDKTPITAINKDNPINFNNYKVRKESEQLKFEVKTSITLSEKISSATMGALDFEEGTFIGGKSYQNITFKISPKIDGATYTATVDGTALTYHMELSSGEFMFFGKDGSKYDLNNLKVGNHEIILTASAGKETATKKFNFTVIPKKEAIEAIKKTQTLTLLSIDKVNEIKVEVENTKPYKYVSGLEAYTKNNNEYVLTDNHKGDNVVIYNPNASNISEARVYSYYPAAIKEATIKPTEDTDKVQLEKAHNAVLVCESKFKEKTLEVTDIAATNMEIAKLPEAKKKAFTDRMAKVSANKVEVVKPGVTKKIDGSNRSEEQLKGEAIGNYTASLIKLKLNKRESGEVIGDETMIRFLRDTYFYNKSSNEVNIRNTVLLSTKKATKAGGEIVLIGGVEQTEQMIESSSIKKAINDYYPGWLTRRSKPEAERKAKQEELFGTKSTDEKKPILGTTTESTVTLKNAELLAGDDFRALLASTDVTFTKSESEKLIAKYGAVGFITYMQAKDGFISIEEANKIYEGYKKFKKGCISLSAQNLKRQELIEQSKSKGRLGEITDDRTRVIIYSTLQYLQEHFTYDKEHTKAGRSYTGLIGYENIPGAKAIMDCDLVSILAGEACKDQGVDMTYFVVRDEATKKPNHVNTKVGGSVVERTNPKNRGYHEGDITVNANNYLGMVGEFFGTYGSPEKTPHSGRLDVESAFVQYSLDNEVAGINDLLDTIDDFGVSDYNKFNKNDKTAYATADINDYEYIGKILLAIKADTRFTKDTQYKELLGMIDSTVYNFSVYVERLKFSRKDIKYDQLDKILTALGITIKAQTSITIETPVVKGKTTTELLSNRSLLLSDSDRSEIGTRQEKDHKSVGRFMDKQPEGTTADRNLESRTDRGRLKDSEIFIQAFLADGPNAIIDIGSGLGNTDPLNAGVTVHELQENTTIKSKANLIIASDIDKNVGRFNALPGHYILNTKSVTEGNFNTPVAQWLKEESFDKSGRVFLRSANGIDLIMNPKQTLEHLAHISSSLYEYEVIYMFNKHILAKQSFSNEFKIIGELNNAGFDHNGKNGRDRERLHNRTAYTLRKK